MDGLTECRGVCDGGPLSVLLRKQAATFRDDLVLVIFHERAEAAGFIDGEWARIDDPANLLGRHSSLHYSSTS
jgi:hypothetical protein